MRNKTTDLIGKIESQMLDPTQRQVEPRVGQVGHCRMFSNVKSINEQERTIEFVCSTATIDRYGERVLPTAFAKSIPTFMQNPVFPYGHMYDAVDGRTPTVGKWLSMKVEGAALVGTAWFKPRGLGEEVWLDYLDGALTSVSVAFLTKAWEFRDETDNGQKQRLRVFTEVELLEVSAVLIPANPAARLRAASAQAAMQRAGGGGGGGGVDETDVDRAVERAIAKHLDTGPGGRLCSLIQDVAESLHGPASHGVEDDWGDDPGRDKTPPARAGRGLKDQGEDEELTQALRGLVGK